MEYRLLVLVVLVALAVVDVASAKKDKKKRSKKAMMGLEIEEIKENLTALWEKMDTMGQPVHVHMHGEGGMVEDHMHDVDGTHVHIHLGHEAQHHTDHEGLLEEDGYFHAQCNIHPGSGASDSITGTIFFKQREGGPLMMKIDLEGFDVSGPRPQHSHGFHLHEYGDLSQGCASLGGHFNPHSTTHGGMHVDHGSRHAGDWGNIQCNSEGVVEDYKVDKGTTLLGEHSIIGRGIVIHEGPDDMGMGGKPDSLKTGAAGGRLACCVTTWHSMVEWEMGPVMGAMEKVEGHSRHSGHHRHVRDVHDHAHHDHAHHDRHDHAHHDHAGHGHHDHAGHLDHAELHDHPDHPGHHDHDHHAHPSLSDFLHGDHVDHYVHGERHHHQERLPKDHLPL